MSDFFQSNTNNTNRPINANSAAIDAFFKKHSKGFLIALAVLVLLIIAWNQCFFIVGEAEQAVVSRFGVITKIIVGSNNHFHEKYKDLLKNELTGSGQVRILHSSGAHFKVPFIDKVEKVPDRLFNYTSTSETINTAEKKQYNVTTYAQWRIADPALFSLKMGTTFNAELQLDNLIHPVIVQAINRLMSEDFISNKDALNRALRNGLATINRDMVLRGIEVTDIQVHRTMLPKANVDTTYDRMKADRAKVAQQLRSDGEQQYQMAVADTDREAQVIEAAAVSKAGRIRGEADAEALAIYAKAYEADPDFFAFWRSLSTLKGAFNKDTTLVLDQNHPLWASLLKWGFGQ